MAALTIFQTPSKDLSLLQSSWSSLLNPVLSNPLTQGFLIPGVTLVMGSNTINHRLGRKLRGYLITGINAAATLYDAQSDNRTPDLTLVLISNAPCKVDLYVF